MNTTIARVLVALVLSLVGCSGSQSEADFSALVQSIPPPSIPPRDVRLTVGGGGTWTVDIEIARRTGGLATYFYKDKENSKHGGSAKMMNHLLVTSSSDGVTWVPVVDRALGTAEVAELNRQVDHVRLDPVPGMDPSHKHLRIEVTCDVSREYGPLGFKKDFKASDALTLHLP